MSELRQDRTSGAWVILAPERNRRTHAGFQRQGSVPRPPDYDPSCPFCPGNENLLPAIIYEGAMTAPPAWQIRVVPNKYPALQRDQSAMLESVDSQPAHNGFGHHEVIIETPRHNADLPDLDRANMEDLIRVYWERYVSLMGREDVRAVLLFRNHGANAGATLRHPHSQVIAAGVALPRLAAIASWGRGRFEQDDRCPTCEDLAFEIAAKERIVEATEDFLVTVPFAAGSPFELRVTPLRHQPSFSWATREERREFALVLQRTLSRLKHALADPAYNYALESWDGAGAGIQSSHWRLRIVPQLLRPGGFELGSGLPINPSRPEDDAETLRASPVRLEGSAR